MPEPVLAQFLRFCGVGGLATVVHVLCAMAVSAALSASPQWANLAGFLAAVQVSYFGHARFTFGVALRSAAQMLRFVILSLLSLAVSSGTVWLVTARLGFGFPVAMAAVALIVPLASYLAMRFWVFAAKEKTPP